MRTSIYILAIGNFTIRPRRKSCIPIVPARRKPSVKKVKIYGFWLFSLPACKNRDILAIFPKLKKHSISTSWVQIGCFWRRRWDLRRRLRLLSRRGSKQSTGLFGNGNFLVFNLYAVAPCPFKSLLYLKKHSHSRKRVGMCLAEKMGFEPMLHVLCVLLP